MPAFRSYLPYASAAIAFALAEPVAARSEPAAAQHALDVETYVRAVLRSHPAARQAAALDEAAAAETKAAGTFPDPIAGFTWDKARPVGAGKGTETGFSVSQTIPWPGTLSAIRRAAARQAVALRADGAARRWDLEIEAGTTFARLLHAREVVEIARAAEADALAIRDLTAKRANLGESREVDRIKAEVEWRREERLRRALEREAAAVEAILRNLAVARLPTPLVLAVESPRALAPLDAEALRSRLAQTNPTLLAAHAASSREAALAAVARRSRVPDLDVTWFRNEELDKTAHGFQVAVRVPLWNANRGPLARAEAAATLAAAAAQRTLVDLTGALEQARQELEAAASQAEVLTNQILPAAERSLDLARLSFREGETSLLDLLDAQRTFRQTQREAAASRWAVASALAGIRRLVGPDFDPRR